MKYLFGLLCSLLLMAAVARADNAPPPNTLEWNIGADPSGPARIDLPPGLGVSPDYAFGATMPILGGLVRFDMTMSTLFDNGVPFLITAFGLCDGPDSVVQFPPGYVDDPSLPPMQRYPYDNCFNPLGPFDVTDPAMFTKTNNGYAFVPGTYDDGLVTITGAATPEPGSMEFILIGLFAFALVAATSKKQKVTRISAVLP